MAYEFENSVFPEFPRTQHLPAFQGYTPNASSDDKIAGSDAFDLILNNHSYAEEKLDGANAGIMYCPSLADDIGQPFLLRNRNHILRKGFTAKTKGKAQFIPFWNWYYSNIDKFELLNKLVGFEACVYGEWLQKPCTIIYDKLPDKFIAYDIWDYQEKRFYPQAWFTLVQAGFSVPPMLIDGIRHVNQLPHFLNETSPWSADESKQLAPGNSKREGVYIKVCSLNQVIARFKMVRADYKPGLSFDDNKDI